MNAAKIVAEMLDAQGVRDLAPRKALGQLPQNTAYPAIVYNVMTHTPDPTLAAHEQAQQMARVRVQINPLAKTIGEIKALHEAIRAEMDFQHARTVAGKLVVSCRFAGYGPTSRDNDIGLWTESADYSLMFYE